MLVLALKGRDQTGTRHLTSGLHAAVSEPKTEFGFTRAHEPGEGFLRYDFSSIPLHAPGEGTAKSRPVVHRSRDEFEREADQVSQKVMNAPEPEETGEAMAPPICQPVPTKRVQFSGTERSGPGRSVAPAAVDGVLSTPGLPLNPSARKFMEARFGYDLSRVRIHAGDRAAALSKSLHARALTSGNDIVFARGEYAPETIWGARCWPTRSPMWCSRGSAGMRAQYSSTAIKRTQPGRTHPIGRANPRRRHWRRLERSKATGKRSPPSLRRIACSSPGSRPGIQWSH